MSSILTGAGGRTYGFDFVKSSPSPAAIRASHTSSSSSSSSSPSSTISESSNSPLAISTRKPRTPRKRPNQTYNEAAALLSTVYPNLFSNENLKQPGRSTGRADVNFLDESAEELFLPFRVFDNSSSSFLLQQQEIQNKPSFPMEPKVVANLQEKQCQSPGEIISRVNSLELDDDCGGEDDFDAESILDEEIDEGIDSVIGSRVEAELEEDANGGGHEGRSNNYWSVDSAGFGFGGNFDFRLGLVRALRPVYEGNWWNFPAVDIVEISPRINKHATTSFTTAEKKDKKTKKKKTTTTTTKKKNVGELPPRGDSIPKLNKASGMMLKLNYDGVLNAWSDRGSPFAGGAGNDVVTIEELFLENGKERFREASVLRYREKRRTRLLSKKIRYQVRKFNADQRPRIKGRFVMRPNTCSKTQRG